MEIEHHGRGVRREPEYGEKRYEMLFSGCEMSKVLMNSQHL